MADLTSLVDSLVENPQLMRLALSALSGGAGARPEGTGADGAEQKQPTGGAEQKQLTGGTEQKQLTGGAGQASSPATALVARGDGGTGQTAESARAASRHSLLMGLRPFLSQGRTQRLELALGLISALQTFTGEGN